MPELKITSKLLSDYKKLYTEFEELSYIFSENVKTAQDRNNENKFEIMRDGKKVKISEKLLWDELYKLGYGDNDATNLFLKVRYPEIYEMKEKELAKIKEIKEFEIKIFGFDHKHVSLPKFVKVVELLIDSKLHTYKLLDDHYDNNKNVQ